MAPKDDVPPPDAPKSLSDYLKDPDFCKQVMDEIIDPNEHPDKEPIPTRRPPSAPREED